MKRILRRTSIVLVCMLFFLLMMPTAAVADDGDFEVSAGTGFDHVVEGGTLRMFIAFMNRTGDTVEVIGYGFNGQAYTGGGIYDNNSGSQFEQSFVVNFGGADQLVISDIYVEYEDAFGERHHVKSDRSVTIQNDTPPTDTTVNFSVTADAQEVEAGTYVNFSISAYNAGNVDYKNFTVTAGGVDIETFDLSPG